MQPTNEFVVSNKRLHPFLASLVGVTFLLPLVCCIAAGLHTSDSLVLWPSSLVMFATTFGTMMTRH